MADQREELKLIVSLQDNASAGLAKLRGEMQKLGGQGSGQGGAGDAAKLRQELDRLRNSLGGFGSGSTHAGLERTQRILEHLARGSIKPLTEGVASLGGGFALMTRGMGVAAAGVGIFATAAYGAERNMAQFAETMTRWTQLADQTGIGVGQLREMANAMRQSGMSTEQADRVLSGLSASMARFARDNRRMRDEIMTQTNPAAREAMKKQLDELLPLANDPAAFANKVREIAANVRRTVTRELGAVRGAQAERQVLGWFNVEDLQNFQGEFRKATAEQIALQKQLSESARRYNELSGKIATNWERAANAIGKIAFDKFKPFMESMAFFSEKFAQMMEFFAKDTPAMTPETKGAMKEGLWEGIKRSPRTMYDILRGTHGRDGGSAGTGSGGGGNGLPGGYGRMPLSDNVIDLRGSIEQETEQSEKLTEQLGLLNDHFNRMFQGQTSAGAGGGPIMLGGGGSPGTGGGAASSPMGSRAGGNAGRTAAEPGAGVPDSANPNLSGSEFLKSQRARFAREMEADPALKLRAAALLQLENPGAGPAVIESAMNRGAMTGRTLASILQGGPKSFYGPARRGMVEPLMAQLQRNPAKLAALYRSIDAAIGGSNVVRGHTDQGSAGDPNYYTGGTGVNINRERFNDWGGHRGVAFSRAWREAQQAQVERARMDKGAANNSTVSGTAKIKVDVNAPPGTNVSAGTEGDLFKSVETTRNPQMMPAGTGASDFMTGAP